MENNKIIAVYGNSGSFKTATSVNLAKTIAKRGRNLSVAVVGLDSSKPLIPMLFPKSQNDTSLGRLLSCENIDQDKIYKEMNMHDNIGFLGYNAYENVQSYAYPTNEKVDDFLMQMRHLFNYTIIDCTSVISYRMTTKSLIGADNVLYLISCDIDGLSFCNSQNSILLAEQYGYHNYLKCLTVSGKFAHDEAAMINAIGGISRVIPCSDSVAEMWNQGRALSADLSDYGGDYNRVISAIADEFT
jgi:MinD-like ATPase involved in chromosome partitioning or flagellar assembly